MKSLIYAVSLLSLSALTVAAETGTQQILRATSQRTQAAVQTNFTGKVLVTSGFRQVAPSRIYGTYVTFEQGARTKWHIHPAGQTLIVTFGKGLTQEWGKAAQEILPGAIVVCPPGVKHWHGAAPGSIMTHLAVSESLEGHPVQWLEEVSEEQYRKSVEDK